MALQRKILIAFLVVGMASLDAQDKPKTLLTNDDVVAMVNGGLDQSLVLSAIDANDVNFDVSASSLLALKKAGVADEIIQAMLAAKTRKHNPPPTAPAPSSPERGLPPQTPAPSQSPLPQGAAMSPMAMNPLAGQPMAAQAMAMQMITAGAMSPQVLARLAAAPRGGAMGSMGLLPGAGLHPPTPTPPPSLDPGQLPKVTLVLGEKKELVKPSMAQIAKSETKGGTGGYGMGMGPSMGSMASVASMAMRGTMGGMGGIGGLGGLSSLAMLGGLGGGALRFAPMLAGPGAMFAGPAMSLATGLISGSLSHHSSSPTTTYVWALPGTHSAFAMAPTTPKFEIEFGDIVGLDPDAYEPALVKLTQTKDNWRLVGATKEKIDKRGNEKRSAITEDRTEIKTTSLGRGHVLVEAAGPLAPGEYGVVLHPVKSQKTAASAGAGLTAEQTIFYSVWDFSVPRSESRAATAHSQQ
ncbi:MAG TPA: hypothetical protein VEI01_00500 [Terriglobales bacterium]|nr:hypothetical protein [Terriglobales bacterium]